MRQFKHLSQVFLTAPAIARLAAESLPECERVLEIGAGQGILTRALIERGFKVTALEVDSRLVSLLRDELKHYKNVKIVEGDALEFDYDDYDCVCGNLPYHLSSLILFRFLESKSPCGVFMLQKEFAERLDAEPDSNDYSRLTVMTQARATVKRVAFVPAACFDPAPKVDSLIVRLDKHAPRPVDEELVRSLFQHKNQTVRNAIEHSHKAIGLEKKEARALGDALPFSNRKPRSLSLDEFEELTREFKQLKPRSC